MAQIEVEVAGRRYTVACRDGEEEHLRTLSALVDRRAQDAAQALGSLSESRQLLFASLLLADDLNDRHGGAPAAAVQAAQTDPRVADALER
ncbi:MAG TPA: cell division protein ZapA, partial [Allosphingosinicella sp.]